MAGTVVDDNVKRIKAKIEKCIKIVEKERDELRALQSELEDYLDSIDKGTEALNEGVQLIESGVEHLSEYW